jgi:hypothetical protein
VCVRSALAQRPKRNDGTYGGTYFVCVLQQRNRALTALPGEPGGPPKPTRPVSAHVRRGEIVTDACSLQIGANAKQTAAPAAVSAAAAPVDATADVDGFDELVSADNDVNACSVVVVGGLETRRFKFGGIVMRARSDPSKQTIDGFLIHSTRAGIRIQFCNCRSESVDAKDTHEGECARLHRKSMTT